MPEQHLLIIDDEVDMLQGLKRVLSYELAGVNVATTPAPLEGLRLVSEQAYDVILVDIRMPDMDGMELLLKIRQIDPNATVIMMTAYGSIEHAVEAIKRGAYDFMTKPFEIPDLLRMLKKGLERGRLIRENLNLRARISEQGTFASFIGQSPPMRRLYEAIQALAHTDYTVLIRGQSGTGKELAARAIHDLSQRKSQPFLAVNCPAIPEHLLESELFGHKKGAFTGADSDHLGLFAEADGATLLLDEIGDIPVSVQTKLLRVLQEQELRPLGSSRTRKINVRILASTNQDLESKISQRCFREDLFYRLNVVTIRMPLLREIREDIPLLANHFSKKFAAELGVPAKCFSPGAMEELVSRSWPGNIRELQNFLRRLLIFCADEEIHATHILGMDGPAGSWQESSLTAGDQGIEPYIQARDRVLDQFTRTYARKLLHSTAGNISQAARTAGLSRVAMQKILRRLDLNPRDFRPEPDSFGPDSFGPDSFGP